MSKFFRFSLLSFLLFSSQAFADVVSLDSNYVAGQANIVDKLNADRVALTNGVNNVRGVYAGSVQSSGQVKAETIGQENLADDANPVLRTNEGASCPDLVVEGLIPSTSGTLIGSIVAGVAYPEGYRVEKTEATAKTFTASKWTYAYILNTGSFTYQEVAIGATQPSTPANSAILFRASTDTATINTVTDLRLDGCTAGPFEIIADASGEATLDDMFAKGQPVRRFSTAGTTPAGYAQGAYVSWDGSTTFKVTSGSLYINGKFRSTSTDTTVSQTDDGPTIGTSGYDGTQAAASKHYVYAVADQDAVPTFSVTYSTSATTPTGVTNYRLIGSIRNDAGSFWLSRDVVTVHGISDYELPGGYISFDGEAATMTSSDSYNVSGIVDNGTGNYTISWDDDFNNAAYVCDGGSEFDDDSTNVGLVTCNDRARGSVIVEIYGSAAGAPVDIAYVSTIAWGDRRK